MPGGKTLVVAYADPPYVGQAKKYYADHPDFAGEVDHGELIGRLVRDYPDGWALSLSSPSTHLVLDHCRDHGLSLWDGDIRLTAWIKPFVAFKRNVRLAYAWEPLILKTAPRLPGAAPARDFIDELALFDLRPSGAGADYHAAWADWREAREGMPLAVRGAWATAVRWAARPFPRHGRGQCCVGAVAGLSVRSDTTDARGGHDFGDGAVRLSATQKHAIEVGSRLHFAGAREVGVMGNTMLALEERGLAYVQHDGRRHIYRLTEAGGRERAAFLGPWRQRA